VHVVDTLGHLLALHVTAAERSSAVRAELTQQRAQILDHDFEAASSYPTLRLLETTGHGGKSSGIILRCAPERTGQRTALNTARNEYKSDSGSNSPPRTIEVINRL